MTIRRISADEAPRVRELKRELTAELARRYPEDRIGISKQGLSNLETLYRVGAVHEDVYTLVAEVDGKLLALATAEVRRSGSLPGVAGEIELLALERAGADAVEALAREAVRVLREAGARVILRYDDAQHPEREPWESLGFKLDTVRFSLYAE